MIMPEIDDPRLFAPQCSSLIPVETVHENPWFAVRNRGGYFTVEYSRFQVIILPVIENSSIVMVRVKRPVINDESLELPAGGSEENETPIQAAWRELAEETGIKIGDLRRLEILPPITNSPNRNPNLTYIFMAHVTQQEYENRGDHDKEITDVECFSLEVVQRLIVNGDIYVSVPMAIISRFIMSDMENLKLKATV